MNDICEHCCLLIDAYKMLWNQTYEHHVFLRAKGDRGGSVGAGFGCDSVVRFNLKPAIDLRRFAARARDARSALCIDSGGVVACEHVLMCACAVAI